MSEPATIQAAVRDLCSRLFADPARLAQTLTHVIARPFSISAHQHRGLLQFDLLDGCTGRAYSDGRWTAISGVTAMVSYPGQVHGYELSPGEPPSRVYHFKLQVQRPWPVVRHRPLPMLATGLSRPAGLIEALDAMMRLSRLNPQRPTLLLVRLAEVLTLWPGGPTEPGTADEMADEALAAALRLIEARLTRPPSLEELARAAHLSPRHLARQFRMRLGCTPHAYMAARRLDQARQMLLGQRFKVHQVADALGFGSVATFSRWFHQHAGVSPTQYRRMPTTH